MAHVTVTNAATPTSKQAHEAEMLSYFIDKTCDYQEALQFILDDPDYLPSKSCPMGSILAETKVNINRASRRLRALPPRVKKPRVSSID